MQALCAYDIPQQATRRDRGMCTCMYVPTFERFALDSCYEYSRNMWGMRCNDAARKE